MNINVLAIDLAKNVFQLCAVDSNGKILKEKKVGRAQLLENVQRLQPKVIAMEACGSANYWARELSHRGFTVKLISPQHVKPFVKGNKNDKQDARAIAEAAQRPTMNFVSPKTVKQQDMQTLLRIREGHVEMCTKTCNQIRGLLAEYGITIPQGVHKLRAVLPSIFDKDRDNGLTTQMKEWIEMQYNTLLVFDENIDRCDVDIERIAQSNETCQRIMKIEGIGKISAVAVIADIGNGSEFKNRRHLSAYLGLVPKQHSSGNKNRLLGISKRDDKHLRTLLIHGGRAVVTRVDNKEDARNLWIKRIKDRRGFNKAAVAVANKNARIILAMLKSGEEYRRAA